MVGHGRLQLLFVFFLGLTVLSFGKFDKIYGSDLLLLVKVVVMIYDIIDKFLQKLILIFEQRFGFPKVVRSNNFVLDEVRQNFLEIRLPLDVIDGIFISRCDSFLGSNEPAVVKKEISARNGLQKSSLTSNFKFTYRRIASFQ